MRPLFYDFPEDKESWNVETEYMFGPKVLVKAESQMQMHVRQMYIFLVEPPGQMHGR